MAVVFPAYVCDGCQGSPVSLGQVSFTSQQLLQRRDWVLLHSGGWSSDFCGELPPSLGGFRKAFLFALKWFLVLPGRLDLRTEVVLLRTACGWVVWKGAERLSCPLSCVPSQCLTS